MLKRFYEHIFNVWAYMMWTIIVLHMVAMATACLTHKAPWTMVILFWNCLAGTSMIVARIIVGTIVGVWENITIEFNGRQATRHGSACAYWLLQSRAGCRGKIQRMN